MIVENKYYEHAKEALIKDGWTITHDPYIVILEKDEEKHEVDLVTSK